MLSSIGGELFGIGVILPKIGALLSRLGASLSEFGATLSEFGVTLSRIGLDLPEIGATLTRIGGTVSGIGGTLPRIGGALSGTCCALMICGALLLRTRGSLPYIGDSLSCIDARLATPSRGGSVIGETLSQVGAALSNMRHGVRRPTRTFQRTRTSYSRRLTPRFFRDGELVRILQSMARTRGQLAALPSNRLPR